MQKNDRKQIFHSIHLLTRPNVIDYAIIKPYLLERKIFTKPMIDDISAERTDTGRVQKLLVDLCTRGPHAFEAFLNILMQTRQLQAIQILSPNFEINVTEVTASNQVDSYRGHSVAESAATQLSTLQLATKWIQNDECYKMSSYPRGLCLIINNDDFNGIKDKREGSEKDLENARKVFGDLGYDVETESNLSASDMRAVLIEFSNRQKHIALDSAIIIIMSHGGKGIVYGTDCEEVNLEYIFCLFNNEKCPKLLGKPKMFFIQACRGEMYDSGVPVFLNFRTVKTDGAMPFFQTEERVPTWNDMLISYSTVEGYVSNRDSKLGTWYIQTLLDVLLRKAWDTDLYSMLQEVSTGTGKIANAYGEKQSTEIRDIGFSKKLYFNPGLRK